MEYKLVDVTGDVSRGTLIFGVEEKIKRELAQGWKLWGSLIVIPPDFEGDQIQVWQAMVKEFEPEPMIYGQHISQQRIEDFVINGTNYDEELDN